MKRRLFFIMTVMILFFTMPTFSQAAKVYFIVANGQEYPIAQNAYELLLGDEDGTWDEYVFSIYGIPLPADNRYILRIKDDGGVQIPSDPTPTPSPKPIRVEKKKIYLLVGDKAKPKLIHYSGSVLWKSKNSRIVKPISGSKIEAKKAGSTTISTKINGLEYQCKIIVKTKTENNQINLAIKEVIKEGMTTREKIKAVHNWIIANVKYDYNNYLRGTVPKISHSSKGALLRGVAVCDGYSYAFKKFMTKLKVQCRVVYGYASGGPHAWNKVKVNGRWRYIDVTFDDPIVNGKNTNKTPYYTYFLKTLAKMNRTHYIMKE